MDRDDLLALFRGVATELTDKDQSALAWDDTIGDAGIDSLAMQEIMGALEERLGMSIPEQRLAGLRTVGQFLEVVESLQER
jgi:acyl carrier protein